MIWVGVIQVDRAAAIWAAATSVDRMVTDRSADRLRQRAQAADTVAGIEAAGERAREADS
ncbi:MAG: hypothetical protein CME72_12325 [Halomonadaceae bacterium]|nr:hypothetical protein [Halomonadaceae bacterium]